MAMWHYVIGEDQLGPVGEEQIEALIRSGIVKSETLLWRPGINSWIRAQALEEFADLFIVPPPLPPLFTPTIAMPPPVPKQSAFQSKLARPWPRYWARLIDILIFETILGFGISYITVIYAPNLYMQITEMNSGLFGVLLLPMIAILLAVIAATTGTSLGKAIIGIRVIPPLGKAGLIFHLRREFRVWFSGLGLGIPIVTLATHLHQYNLVKNGNSAGYDNGGTEVVGSPSSARVFVGAAAAIVLVCFFYYLEFQDKQDRLSLYGNQVWVDPINNRTASIAKAWKIHEITTNSGRVFEFAWDAQLAEVIFGYEVFSVDGVDNLTYAKALRNAIASDVNVTSDWAPLNVHGHQGLRATGRSVKIADTNVQVTTVVIGRNAWRTLVFSRGRQLSAFPAGGELTDAILSTAD